MLSGENSDAITNAVNSLGLMTHPIDEMALREVKWPQLTTAHQIRHDIPSSTKRHANLVKGVM